ncbi:MAG: hypothetical protein RIT14_2137 [Pseudomonadota bacterium]
MTPPVSDHAPRFSIIIVDYEGAVPRDIFRRKIASLAAQDFRDFEVLVYHDGPKATSYAEDVAGLDLPPGLQFHITPTRANDWGHSNRDRGIRAARGDWILHSNADNLLYPDCLRVLSAAIDSPNRALRHVPLTPAATRRRALTNLWLKLTGRRHAILPRPVEECAEKQVLIYAVLMRGLRPCGTRALRSRDAADRYAMIYSGFPTRRMQIDAMQLVMRRDLWLAEGGWYDRRHDADGRMYEDFAQRYAVLSIPQVLGEHW